jgi:hypothetical protein
MHPILAVRRPQVRRPFARLVVNARERLLQALSAGPLGWREASNRADCAPGTARRILSTDPIFVRVEAGIYTRR